MRSNAWVSLRCSGNTTVTTSPAFPARAVRPDGTFDHDAWAEARGGFRSYVVED